MITSDERLHERLEYDWLIISGVQIRFILVIWLYVYGYLRHKFAEYVINSKYA